MQRVDPSWTLAVLVCCNERSAEHRLGCCGKQAGETLVGELRDRARASGIRKRLVVHRVGCLNACGGGSTVALFGQSRSIVKVESSDMNLLWQRVCAEVDRTVTP